MTRRTNARVAGFLFLLYIATAYPQVVLFGRASRGADIAGQLASIAAHAPLMRLTVVLSLVTFVVAVVLATALYGLTRDTDRDLAVLALACRVGEGLFAVFPVVPLGLLWLATGAGGTAPPDSATVAALGALLMKVGTWQTLAASTCFAVGSTLFAWLFLRARSIPVWLAWTGVLGSALLVVGLPLQTAGYVSGTVTSLIWIPVAVFEIVLAFWLLIVGVRPSARPQPAE